MENKRKKKILILCPYPYDQAAGQRLKYEQYIERWEKNDFTVILSPYMNNSLWKVAYLRGHYLKKILGVLNGHWQRFRDLFRIKEFDIIYIFHGFIVIKFNFIKYSIQISSKKNYYCY